MSERKRQKTTTLTKFEQLPNELLLICFDYFDYYYLYETFSSLNQHFKNLIQYRTEIYLNMKLIPNEKFLPFCSQLNQLITTNHNYSLSIRINNNYRFNSIFQDNLFNENFSRIKSLKITNVTVSTLLSIIFDGKTNLCHTLERLSLFDKIGGTFQDIDRLCCDLISSKMKLLKHLDLNFILYSTGDNECEEYVDLEFYGLSIGEKSFSNLETIIIGYIPYDDTFTTSKLSFKRLIKRVLPCMPKLKTLMINSIYFDTPDNYRQEHKVWVSSSTKTNLKLVKIWVDVNANEQRDKEKMEKYLQNYFTNENSTFKTTIKIFFVHS
ncbi:unnamed protein product [Adineta steineri]|uniref:F-box domain-containing protein n=1 Tax=Adineta steineri TaxID=433720 RepID=A0A815X4X0_9BILA|nr:unnamed protein product [Adineta steineri]CAF1552680.1 unnamed protein product [Adineta steineri]